MKKILLSLGFAMVASVACAKTVTVNSGGGANHATISAALTDVRTAADGLDIIEITGGGPYVEATGIALLDESITLRGTNSANPPVIVVGPTAGQPAASLNDFGIAIGPTTVATVPMTVTLENLIVIPSTTTQPLRGIRSNSNATGLHVTMRFSVRMTNVTVTGNNGSNQPVALNSSNPPAVGGSVKYFRDDAILLAGRVDFQGTDLTAINVGLAANSPDGFVFVSDDPSTCVLNGPADISYNSRCGIQLATDGCHYELNGTTTDPIKLIGNNRADTGGAGLAIWHDNFFGAPPQPAESAEIYSGIIVADTGLPSTNAADGISVLFGDPNEGIANLSMTKVASSGNANDGWNSSIAMVGSNNVIQDSTFVRNGTGPFTVSDPRNASNVITQTVAGSITLRDCIVAGDGRTTEPTGQNTIRASSIWNTINLQNSAIVLDGNSRLAGNGITVAAGAAAPVVTNSINADPQFRSFDANNELFVWVSNAAYLGAGTAGSDLTGYGYYTDAVNAVSDWQLFQ